MNNLSKSAATAARCSDDDDEESSRYGVRGDALKNNNKDKEAAAVPFQIKVEGAGTAAANGIYTQDGYFQNAVKYSKKNSNWYGHRRTFYILRCLVRADDDKDNNNDNDKDKSSGRSTKNSTTKNTKTKNTTTKDWFISIVPAGCEPGNSTDIDFYRAYGTHDNNNDGKYCHSVPPSDGWLEDKKGVLPVPVLSFLHQVEETVEKNDGGAGGVEQRNKTMTGAESMNKLVVLAERKKITTGAAASMNKLAVLAERKKITTGAAASMNKQVVLAEEEEEKKKKALKKRNEALKQQRRELSTQEEASEQEKATWLQEKDGLLKQTQTLKKEIEDLVAKTNQEELPEQHHDKNMETKYETEIATLRATIDGYKQKEIDQLKANNQALQDKVTQFEQKEKQEQEKQRMDMVENLAKYEQLNRVLQDELIRKDAQLQVQMHLSGGGGGGGGSGHRNHNHNNSSNLRHEDDSDSKLPPVVPTTTPTPPPRNSVKRARLNGDDHGDDDNNNDKK